MQEQGNCQRDVLQAVNKQEGMHCIMRLGTQHNVIVAAQAYLSLLLWPP